MKHLSWILLVLLFSCKLSKKEDNPVIVCSTSIIANSVKEIVGSDVKVVALMGPGIDPHSYKPKPHDVYLLNNAALIVFNGCHLEGKMVGVFNVLKHRKNVIAVADSYPKKWLIHLNDRSLIDPHIWFNPEGWALGMQGVKNKLCELFPKHKHQFEHRFNTFQERCKKVTQDGRETLLKIPVQQRVLITSHDAFHYYGVCFGIKVKALQGVSTTQEPGIRDVVDLVNFIVKYQIKALFIEQSVSPKTIESLIQSCRKKNHQVRIGGELYSDALGEKEKQSGSYIGMIKYNTHIIANYLSK
jgi:manganese/zinc/iron transport system substrate-binding protein